MYRKNPLINELKLVILHQIYIIGNIEFFYISHI